MSRKAWALVSLGLLLLGLTVAEATRRRAFLHVAWPDECIYLVGARNLVERGTLDTNFYLTHSLLVRGYPHRDVHMPGYMLVLAPVVALLGPTLTAGAALNVLAYLASIALVLVFARRVLADDRQAVAAAAFFAILPPFRAYLFVVYPELVTTAALLAQLAWLVSGGGVAHAVVDGVLFGLGPVFRETLLVSLPLHVVWLRRRDLWRGFVPAALATLLLVVAPLGRNRAVHPNALYPSLVEEALGSPRPVAALWQTVSRNVRENLRLTLEARPAHNAEDATLAFLALLTLAAAVSTTRLRVPARRLGAATLLAMAALATAAVVLYVVRARGGVWGGVRAFMTWAPALLVLATPLGFRPRRAVTRLSLAVLLAAGFLALGAWQVRFFDHYKAANREDQLRQARYMARYIDPARPHRVVARDFLYGWSHYPVEVIWSLPRSYRELRALEQAIDYEFLVIHESSPLRLYLIDNPRYLRVNADDRRAEFLIWRRVY
jgi:hypothetical protein